MPKAITKQERELIVSLALRNRASLTFILNSAEARVENVPGSHAMLKQIQELRPKIAAIQPEYDLSCPYWDMEQWY